MDQKKSAAPRTSRLLRRKFAHIEAPDEDELAHGMIGALADAEERNEESAQRTRVERRCRHCFGQA
jgi:hypothetical protein